MECRGHDAARLNSVDHAHGGDKDVVDMVEEQHGKNKIVVSFNCETLKSDKAAEEHIIKFLPNALGATTHGHMLHGKGLDYSTHAYDNLDVLFHDVGNNTLAAPHVIGSTLLGLLNTSAAAFDNSMASQLVNMVYSEVAASLGSYMLLGTLLISTVVSHMSDVLDKLCKNFSGLRTSLFFERVVM